MKCKKCKGNGNVFIKNDYADRYLKSTQYYKGKAGKWCKCKKCGGTGKVIKLKQII